MGVFRRYVVWKQKGIVTQVMETVGDLQSGWTLMQEVVKSEESPSCLETCTASRVYTELHMDLLYHNMVTNNKILKGNPVNLMP